MSTGRPGLGACMEPCKDDEKGKFTLEMKKQSWDLISAMAFALELDAPEELKKEGNGRDIDYDALESKLCQKLDAFVQAEDSIVEELVKYGIPVCRVGEQMKKPSGDVGNSDEAGKENGAGKGARVGNARVDQMGSDDVELTIEKGMCQVCVEGPGGEEKTRTGGIYRVVGMENFSSVVGNVPVTSGKWMYEVQVMTSGIMQIGWATPTTIYTREDGVGDSRDSFAFDGKRVRKWNVSSVQYGERWTAGDIIGCCIDLDDGKVSYFRNGKFLGVAFSSVRRPFTYFPGVSLSYAESCRINFGALPLKYQLPNYKPLQRPPAEEFMQKSEYLLLCMERLVIVGEMGKRVSPKAAAAAAATSAAEFLDSSHRIKRKKGFVDYRMPNGKIWDNQDMLDAQKKVASRLMQYLGPLFRNGYIVDSCFIDVLVRLYHYSNTGSAINKFIELVASCISHQDLTYLLYHVCQSIGQEVSSTRWLPEHFPYCEATDALDLWIHFMKNLLCRYTWFSSGAWMEQLEMLLFVRQPTSTDLGLIMPFSTGPDIDEVIQSILDQEMSSKFVVDITSDLISCHSTLENSQTEILKYLLEDIPTPDYAISGGEDFLGPVEINDIDLYMNEQWEKMEAKFLAHSEKMPGSSQHQVPRGQFDSYLGRYENTMSTVAPRNEWSGIVADALISQSKGDVPVPLAKFISYLRQKNAHARRDIPPPGLTNKSVIASAMAFTLRLLRPFMTRVHIKGEGFIFPKRPFLDGAEEELECSGNNALQSDSRLGGTISFMMKTSLVEICNDIRTNNNLKIPAISEDKVHTDWASLPELRPKTLVLEKGSLIAHI